MCTLNIAPSNKICDESSAVASLAISFAVRHVPYTVYSTMSPVCFVADIEDEEIEASF